MTLACDDRVSAIRDYLVGQSLERLAGPPTPLVFTGDKAADALVGDLEHHPHAYVIACLMDRQTKAEKAWFVPHRLRERLGTFSFPALAALAETELSTAMTVPYPLHWLTNEMTRTLIEGIGRIADVYEGDAARIWGGRPSSAAIIRRFLEFRGAGPKTASMAANILVRDFRVEVSDRYSIDISVDAHVRRVFSRLGLVPDDASNELITFRARELYPQYPGVFDLALWELGRSLCRPHGPQCDACHLAEWCASAGSVTP